MMVKNRKIRRSVGVEQEKLLMTNCWVSVDLVKCFDRAR
jgi:hypothetical protein